MVKNLFHRFFWPLVTIGFLLQIFVSATTYHPDIRAFVLASKYINQGEIFTFYDHVSQLPQTDEVKKIYGDDIFIYPPLAYLIPSAFYLPFTGLLSGAQETITLHDGNIHGLFAYPALILYKLPFLIFAFLVFFFLPKLFDNREKGRTAQLIWLFAPVTFYVAAGVGQVDTILAFFLLMSLISIKKNSLTKASIYIALSALIKPLGLALLPLVAVKAFRNGGLRKACLSVLPGVLVWMAFILPYLHSPAFKMYALMADLAGKSAYAGISISTGTVIPWLYIIYLLITLFLFTGRLSLINSIGLTILSTLAFNHFHPQWFLWLMPWLLYYSVSHKYHYLWVSLLLCWTLIWISFDPSQNIGLFTSLQNIFTPTTPNLLQNSPVVLFGRAGLVATLFYLLYELTKED